MVCWDMVLYNDIVLGGICVMVYLEKVLEDLVEGKVDLEKCVIMKMYIKDYVNFMLIFYVVVVMKMCKVGEEVCKGDKI